MPGLRILSLKEVSKPVQRVAALQFLNKTPSFFRGADHSLLSHTDLRTRFNSSRMQHGIMKIHVCANIQGERALKGSAISSSLTRVE